jgi:hypothetical protein
MKTNTYDGLTARFNAAMLTSTPSFLEGDDMQGWIENPSRLGDALRRTLLPVQHPTSDPPKLEVWLKLSACPKELRISSHFYDALEREKALSHREIYERFYFSQEQVGEIELVEVTLTQLGLLYGATRRNIYARAAALGLDLCPIETAARICLEHAWRNVKVIRIASQILESSTDRSLAFFGVSYNINLAKAFDLVDGKPHVFFENDGTWVFKRRQSPVGL